MAPATGETGADEQTSMTDVRPSAVFLCRIAGHRSASTEVLSGTGPDTPNVLRCASSDLDRLSSTHADADFLLLVDHPANVVAGRAVAGSSAAAALRDWCQSAAHMQRQLRRHRRQTLMLSTEELAKHGLKLPETLLSGRPWLAGVLTMVIDDDLRAASITEPLVAMLARHAAERDSVAHDLYCELLAACQPVGEDGPAPSATDMQSATRTGSGWYLESIDTLHGTRDELARLRPHALALQSQLEERSSALQAQRDALADSSAQCESLGVELSRAQQESTELLKQLHSTQEDLEKLFLEQRSAAAAQLVARTALELESDRLRAAQAADSEAQKRLAAAERELDALRQQRTEFEDAKQAMLAREAQLSGEAESLLLQLHQTQEELESKWLQLTAAQADAEQSKAESQRLHDEVRSSRDVWALAQRQADQALAACRGDRRAAQEQALAHFLRLDAYEGSGPGRYMTLAPTVEGATADLGRIVIGATHESGEHRHIDLELLQARMPRGTDAPVRLRLLEHAGRPGLALLRKEGEPEPLGAWQTHGLEGDMQFCLLIPGDIRCQVLWLRLGGADWRFLVTLAVQLEALLAEVALPAAPFWRAVARRLRMQLWQLPPRLRYDGVEVFGDTAGDGTAAVRIEFRQAVFGVRELGTVALCWRPAAGYSSDASVSVVACLYDPARSVGAPPLASWPVAADGTWAPAVSLPVGPNMPKALRRRLWAALPSGDRQFVLALLDAMPAASGHPESAPAIVPAQTATVAHAAGNLHKQARRTVLNLELRRNLRGLLRR